MLSTVISKRTVSFEDALRQLAAAVTGAPLAAIPKTQEGAVLYIAEFVSKSKSKETEEPEAEAEQAAAEEPKAEEAEGSSLTVAEIPAEAAEEAPAAKKTSTAKRMTKKKASTTT